jgi:hypothetical protein
LVFSKTISVRVNPAALVVADIGTGLPQIEYVYPKPIEQYFPMVCEQAK